MDFSDHMYGYYDFLQKKNFSLINSGFDIDDSELNPMLFDFQKAIVKWSLKRGRSAIFADCGLGKTPMQLEWARQVNLRTGQNILIVAPLAISLQTQREGNKFGIEVNIIKSQEDIKPGINITNYEKLDKFDCSVFGGIVLDESSIIKSFTGKTTQTLLEKFEKTPFKLACTATPSPNDYTELGNHCEFLNVIGRNEMLAMFFINDASNVGDWRLKKHAEAEFWKFVGSWAVMLQRPDDLGFNGHTFILPEKKVHNILLKDEKEKSTLFSMPAQGLSEIRESQKESMEERCKKTAELIKSKPNEQWLIWCQFNDEGDLLEKLIDGAVQVKGSDSDEHKEKSVIDFANGDIKILISKVKMTGFGVNWQSCHNMIFCGLSFSYEGFYQAIRRCWRFGQKENVDIYCVLSEREISTIETIQEKERKHEEMNAQIINSVKTFFNYQTMEKPYLTDEVKNDRFTAKLGDSVERIKEVPDESIDFMIYSPPFSDLYTYSNSERDMGNSKNDDEFYAHFEFLARDLFRVLKEGRNMSVHCMNLSYKKFKDGYIGMKDFRGDLIRLFEKVGFILHSEVTIWKDPVVQMQRTKALTLLHKQIKKDSAMSAQGYAEYLITFRKPGINKEPISHTADDFPVEVWQKYASPVWMDINVSETLQKQSAREDKDEKHICPLQLDVIRRAVYLWSNPGDLVLSPFMGIGSEGHVSLECGRRFIGIELKKSYYDQAVKNLEIACNVKQQLTIPL